MILQCNYEELLALKQGARSVLGTEPGEEGAMVLAPPADRAAVEALVPQLVGDVAIPTLAEQRKVEDGVLAIVTCLRVEMETAVTATHAASEEAVAAYFDFAHALTVLERLRGMGEEMEALIEVVTGEPADDRIAETFLFPG